ncbi:hypothetical protein Tco_1290202, partial [Tanacetum coccineum]
MSCHVHPIGKSQRSTNSSASSGSNPAMFQDMLQQQYELDRKEKMECLDHETATRVKLFNSQKVAKDLKVLQIDTRDRSRIKKHIEDATTSTITIDPDWHKLDRLIKMWILRALSESLQDEIVTTPSTQKNLWDNINYRCGSGDKVELGVKEEFWLVCLV